MSRVKHRICEVARHQELNIRHSFAIGGSFVGHSSFAELIGHCPREAAMGWGNWTRRRLEVATAREPLGVDLNAGRARAAHGKPGRNKLFFLDDPEPDLPLAISLENRTPEIGRSANAACRKLPHAICVGILPHLGDPREWKSGRHSLTGETATALAVERLQQSCRGHDGMSFALPAYLNFNQVSKFINIAAKAKIKVR